MLSQQEAFEKFKKRRTAFKNYCLGRDYTKVLEAMSFAEKYHKGFRKDGITPEFQHQLDICLYATTLKGLSKEDEAILLQVILLHDVVEDYNVSLVEIEQKFGSVVKNSVECISKIVHNIKKPMAQYMMECSNDLYASLAKGCDRIHNVQTMKNAFSLEKMEKYGNEVKEWFFPMLRNARDNFPQYRQAFNNIKHMLESQLEWVDYFLASKKVNKEISNSLPESSSSFTL